MAKRNGVFHSCPNCGPGIDCIQEHWVSGDDGPFRIRYIKHIHGVAMTHKDEIILKEKPDGYMDVYSFCSRCNSLTRSYPIHKSDLEIFDEQ